MYMKSQHPAGCHASYTKLVLNWMKQYLLSIVLLLAGLFLLILGLKQYESKVYYSETISVSGVLEHFEKEMVRYGTRYHLNLEDHNLDFQIPAITSAAFDVEGFQSTVRQGDLIELEIMPESDNDNPEIIGLKFKGVNYLDPQKRNAKRRRNGGAALIASLIFIGSALWEIKKKTKHNNV